MNAEQNISATALTSLEGIRSVYFIGIGGIGMSALARYFVSRGIRVAGYDRTETPLTKELEQEGIAIHYSEDVNNIPRDADIVVYTPAIPAEHQELVYYRKEGFRVVKRSDVLQAISAGSFNICVAGTHGKTTISTMIAHLLRHTGYGCNAFLGGISVNYHTNFWSSEKNVSVIEADEYDRSFLKLSPDMAVITAMDADHLDIYGDEKSMQDAFVAFGNQVRKEGWMLSKHGLKRAAEIHAGKKLTYSLQNEAADVYASDIRIEKGGYQFNAHIKDSLIEGLSLRIGGMHNVENVMVAITVAQLLEIDEDRIREAVAAFRGVKRRFEYILPPVGQEKGGYVMPVMIDDYAHHPEELRALLKSVRSLFPQRVVTVVFQPHLYTRTRDLADGFGEVLSMADNLILLPVYPAREEPIEGVSSQLILEKTSDVKGTVQTKEEMLQWMQQHEINKEFGEVIVMAGAGDIDALVEPVKEIITKK